MSTINYSEIYTINLPIEHMGAIIQMVDPYSYMRLFENNSKVVQYDKNKSDRLNQQAELEQLKKELKEESCRSKNLISLIMIYKTIKSTKYEGGFCTIKLNTMLTFELYTTLSIHINKNRKALDKLYEKLDKLDDVCSSEYINLQSEISDLYSSTEVLKELNDYVVKVLRPESLFELMEQYPKLTPQQHAERCLL